MKTLISNNGDYKLYAEIIQPVYNTGHVQLKFSTQWQGAKNPDEFQTKFEAFLTKEDLTKLKDFFSN